MCTDNENRKRIMRNEEEEETEDNRAFKHETEEVALSGNREPARSGVEDIPLKAGCEEDKSEQCMEMP